MGLITCVLVWLLLSQDQMAISGACCSTRYLLYKYMLYLCGEGLVILCGSSSGFSFKN